MERLDGLSGARVRGDRVGRCVAVVGERVVEWGLSEHRGVLGGSEISFLNGVDGIR